MKERPIIMGAESVRAILDGRKTQTRRVVRPQPANGVRYSVFVPSGLEDKHGRELRPPWYVGDRLWVRETWCGPFDERRGPKVLYRANLEPGFEYPSVDRWSSPIHMPRWASRITLEVTEVRCQRLQEISEDDARAEGVPPIDGPGTLNGAPARVVVFDRSYAFVLAWDALNAKRGHPWASNPWVWAVTFRRIEEGRATA